MLSVITPVFNSDRFVESCIQNVIQQDCAEVEHLIVDGGSTDGTVAIIQQYAEQYPHIRWISEKDRGQSDAMNKGIALAKGDVLSFLNVDDYYEKGVLNTVVEHFRTLPKPSILVGNCNVWNDQDRLLFVNRPQRLKLRDLLLGDEANHFPINPSAYFYHTSLHDQIGLYSMEEHYVMDLDFLLRAVQVAHTHYLDCTLGNFRMLEGTKTTSDYAQGEGPRRKRRLLMHYRKDLPWLERQYVAVAYELYELKRQLKTSAYTLLKSK